MVGSMISWLIGDQSGCASFSTAHSIFEDYIDENFNLTHTGPGILRLVHWTI